MSFSHFRTFQVNLFVVCLVCILTLASRPANCQTASAQGPADANSSQSALVEFDDKILFTVYATSDEDAQDRAQDTNDKLDRAWLTGSNGSLPQATVSNYKGTPVILLGGQHLIYVTENDSTNAGMPDDVLASSWVAKINASFRQKQLEQAPQYIRVAIKEAAINIGLGAAVLVIIVYVGGRFKLRRLWSFYLLIGLFVVIHVINLFVASRSIYFNLSTGPMRPLFILVYVAAPAAAISRGWSMFLHSLFPPLPEQISSEDLIRRTNLRRRTLAGVAEVSGVTMIWVIAFAIGMSWYGFNPSSLLTSAGLIGVAIGLVAQDTIRDHLAGMYILADDRYGMGDIIRVGDYEGRVERLNLRMTQLRDMSGRLITLSNRNTTEVANLTARWAQVDFRTNISYYASLDSALSVLEETAVKLGEEWPDKYLDKPVLIGVESYNDINITLRLVVRTPPGDQSLVAHELRKRVKLAFERERITMFNDQKLDQPPS